MPKGIVSLLAVVVVWLATIGSPAALAGEILDPTFEPDDWTSFVLWNYGVNTWYGTTQDPDGGNPGPHHRNHWATSGSAPQGNASWA